MKPFSILVSNFGAVLSHLQSNKTGNFTFANLTQIHFSSNASPMELHNSSIHSHTTAVDSHIKSQVLHPNLMRTCLNVYFFYCSQSWLFIMDFFSVKAEAKIHQCLAPKDPSWGEHHHVTNRGRVSIHAPRLMELSNFWSASYTLKQWPCHLLFVSEEK